MTTGWEAFRLSFVLFMIPFGFAFNLSLLGQGPLPTSAVAFILLLAAIAGWSAIRFPRSSHG